MKFSHSFSFNKFFVGLITVISIIGSAAAAAAAAEPVELTILFMNDIHSRLRPFYDHNQDKEVGGLDRVGTMLKRIREKENPIFLVAGDMFQGTLFFNFFGGEAEIEVLNKLEVDAVSLGNHEFDRGIDNLIKMVQKARFPLLNSNLKFQPGAILPEVIKPYVILERGGLKIAVIGMITVDLIHMVDPSSISGITVESPLKIAQELVEKLRPEVDLIVVLAHIGMKDDLSLAALIPGVDIIIGGHSHTTLMKPIVMENTHGNITVVGQAGEHTRYLGFMKLKVTPGKRNPYDRDRFTLEHGGLLSVGPEIESDPEVSELIDKYGSQIDDKVKQEIGKTEYPLDGERTTVRYQESNLGNFICDVMVEFSNVDIAFFNGGGIRNSIPGPIIRIEDVLSAIPFDNTYVTLELRGTELLETLTLCARRAQEGWGGFLQMSRGMKVVYRKGAVESASFEGQPIDPNRIYRIAIPDFLAAGGDGHHNLAGKSLGLAPMIKISDLVLEYLQNHHDPLEYLPEGRISIEF